MPHRISASRGGLSRPGMGGDALPAGVGSELRARTAGIIDDNAKRSVSVRINTSDYGRIRWVARRLRVREAEVFRYLLQVGLSRIAPLLAEELDAAAFLRALVDLGPDLSEAFDCRARQFVAMFQTSRCCTLPMLTEEDLDLVDLAFTHPQLVLSRLGAGRTGGTVAARAALLQYLNTKYLSPVSS